MLLSENNLLKNTCTIYVSLNNYIYSVYINVSASGYIINKPKLFNNAETWAQGKCREE